MDFKVVRTSEKKLDELVKYEANFGWKLDKFEKESAYFARTEEKKETQILNKLEDQAKRINRIIPLDFIFNLVIAVALLGSYLFIINQSNSNDIPAIIRNNRFLFLIIGGLFLGVSIYLLFIFIFHKINRKSLTEDIINKANTLRGIKCIAPLKQCMEHETADSGILSKTHL